MISENVRRILAELPEGVDLVAAAKERAPEEVLEAVDAGVRIIGENYIRDAQKAHRVVGKRARWHFIGIPSRQKHDLLRRKTLDLFDMLETVDSIDIAAGIDRKCGDIGKVMPVLIEINSGREAQKSGVMPDDAEGLIREIAGLRHVRITGLMTMGPRFGDPEDSRPYFVHTRKLFERIRGLQIANVEMKHLSMGMTNSFPVALQEGATMVRIGTKIFGERAG